MNTLHRKVIRAAQIRCGQLARDLKAGATRPSDIEDDLLLVDFIGQLKALASDQRLTGGTVQEAKTAALAHYPQRVANTFLTYANLEAGRRGVDAYGTRPPGG